MTADPDISRHDAAPLVRGVLALELSDDSVPTRDAVGQQAAGALATRLGRDLGVLVPGVRDLDLVFAAAHFDPAELLRPGWPMHRRLEELRARAPQAGQGPRIIAFGADDKGETPLPFRADRALAGGRLRVLPYLFVGEAAATEAVSAHMESMLLDLGMVQADTALQAQDAFGARIEHARYLTLHDLLAMTALQYRNQGLAPLWDVLETALLAPADEIWLDAPPEPLLRHAQGEVRMALLGPDDWRRRCAPGEQDEGRLAHGLAMHEARQRQFAAVLQAHGVPVEFVHVTPGQDPRTALA
ncbi:hypothetical protein MNO14_00190 [Luteimonas sp. S4-F44]|uniref:hypothetical protein n=1 Tax=Luteimonas sp. S4-F44 TaxID=2925842 RepID=UPI001F531288|nr:hypothetical protein [Luteimonas sp. S4-F44]UNK42566.1 hypothetical protein MNO14_00190 [Luteimonas sp. S4-F44]